MEEELVDVALAGDAVEGAMIRGLLEGAGIPAFLRPSVARGEGSEMAFGMLARGSTGGPQDVMVPAAQADEAARVLADAEAGGDEASAE